MTKPTGPGASTRARAAQDADLVERIVDVVSRAPGVVQHTLAL